MNKKIKPERILIVNFVGDKIMEVMNLETRKINLINWISSVQEEDVLAEMEKIQKKKSDWWDAVSKEDRVAVKEGLERLDKGDYLSRSQVRNKIREKYNF